MFAILLVLNMQYLHYIMNCVCTKSVQPILKLARFQFLTIQLDILFCERFFFFKFHFITANYVKNRRIMQKMEDSNPWTQVLLCKLGLTSKVTHKSADAKSYTVWYSQLKSWFHIVPTPPPPPPWRVLPYFGMVGRFCNDDPRLLDLRSNWGSHFMPQHNLIDPLFLQKKLVCLYHI